jgi:hypothetical protein
MATLVIRTRGGGESDVRLKGERLSCRLSHGSQVIALMRPGDRRAAATGDTLRCTVAPLASGEHHLEVWGADREAPPQRLWAGDLAGPTEIPSAFAVGGSGEMRLYFVWSRAPMAALRITRRLIKLPDNPAVEGAHVDWVAVTAGGTTP